MAKPNPARSTLHWLGGAAVGAFLAHYLDWAHGHSRRALLRDRLNHLGRRGGRALRSQAANLRNRAYGFLAEARSRIEARARPVNDDVLVARVASRIGRLVANPHPLLITAEDGVVAISGPCFFEEVGPLLRAIRRVPGVRGIESGLEPHRPEERIPSLQGRRSA